MEFELKDVLSEIELGALCWTAVTHGIAPKVIWDRLYKEKMIKYSKKRGTFITELGNERMSLWMRQALRSDN